MKKIATYFLIFSLVFPFISLAGGDGNGGPTSSPIHKTELTGQVIDKDTKEELVCATVQLKGTDVKVSTDMEGKFSIKGLDPGNYTLEVSYISYKESVIEDTELTINSGKDLLIQLEQLD